MQEIDANLLQDLHRRIVDVEHAFIIEWLNSGISILWNAPSELIDCWSGPRCRAVTASSATAAIRGWLVSLPTLLPSVSYRAAHRVGRRDK